MSVLKQNNHMVLCRNVNIHQPMECEKAANQLYSRYFGIFERANAIIKERDRTPLDIPDMLFPEKLAVPDASGCDEDRDSSFEILADKIRDTIEASCDLAEQLIQTVGQKPYEDAAESS